MFKIEQKDLVLYREETILKAKVIVLQADFKSCEIIKETYLSSAELLQYDTYKIKNKQHQFLLGRIASKIAVQTLCQIDYKAIEIKSGVFGQPLLQLNSYEQIQLSISHKNDCAAVVVCEVGHPMAIDIEINGDKLNYEVVAKQCTLRELSLTQSIPENIRYGLLWTAKEAISKVLKTGLMTPFQLFEITKVQFNKNKIFQYHFLMDNFSQYQIISEIKENYIISIALPKRSNWVLKDESNILESK